MSWKSSAISGIWALEFGRSKTMDLPWLNGLTIPNKPRAFRKICCRKPSQTSTKRHIPIKNSSDTLGIHPPPRMPVSHHGDIAFLVGNPELTQMQICHCYYMCLHFQFFSCVVQIVTGNMQSQTEWHSTEHSSTTPTKLRQGSRAGCATCSESTWSLDGNNGESIHMLDGVQWKLVLFKHASKRTHNL